jgi:uridine kinase
VPFATTFARMAARDGSDPDPLAPGNRRYLEGQELYIATAAPQRRATIVIDNTDLAAPVITRRNDAISN